MDADLRSPSSSDEEFMDCGAGDGGTPPVVTPQQMAMLATGYGDLNLGQKQMWQDIPSFTDNSVPQTMPLSADQVTIPILDVRKFFVYFYLMCIFRFSIMRVDLFTPSTIAFAFDGF